MASQGQRDAARGLAGAAHEFGRGACPAERPLGRAGLYRFLAACVAGDIAPQKRELAVHAVKAPPQVRQTGLDRPEPLVQAVQAGNKIGGV